MRSAAVLLVLLALVPLAAVADLVGRTPTGDWHRLHADWHGREAAMEDAPGRNVGELARAPTPTPSAFIPRRLAEEAKGDAADVPSTTPADTPGVPIVEFKYEIYDEPQRVALRWGITTKATELGIVGYCGNRVGELSLEGLAQGSADKMEQFKDWLKTAKSEHNEGSTRCEFSEEKTIEKKTYPDYIPNRWFRFEDAPTPLWLRKDKNIDPKYPPMPAEPAEDTEMGEAPEANPLKRKAEAAEEETKTAEPAGEMEPPLLAESLPAGSSLKVAAAAFFAFWVGFGATISAMEHCTRRCGPAAEREALLLSA